MLIWVNYALLSGALVSYTYIVYVNFKILKKSTSLIQTGKGEYVSSLSTLTSNIRFFILERRKAIDFGFCCIYTCISKGNREQ